MSITRRQVLQLLGAGLVASRAPFANAASPVSGSALTTCRISGFVFAKCTDCGPGKGYGSLTLEEVLDDHIKPLAIPAWYGMVS